jgi:hypothetical protein
LHHAFWQRQCRLPQPGQKLITRVYLIIPEGLFLLLLVESLRISAGSSIGAGPAMRADGKGKLKAY